jgi:hypothetical protein
LPGFVISARLLSLFKINTGCRDRAKVNSGPSTGVAIMDKAEVVMTNALAPLHTELRALIVSSRQRLVASVNAELSQLYWSVGRRLSVEVLAGERA